jgi:hypothetical protein
MVVIFLIFEHRNIKNDLLVNGSIEHSLGDLKLSR